MTNSAGGRRPNRPIRTIGWLIALLVGSQRWIGAADAGRESYLPLPSPARASAHDAFRLGTAGRPFGWSTAVGDLNADGRADYAVADRLGRRASGAEYAVEVWISGVGSRSVRFDAPDEALSVTLRDVDHDHDLDLVVTALLSQTVVRVWLNDGHGSFQEAASPAAFGAPVGASRVDTPDAAAGDAVADATPRRADGVRADVSMPVPVVALDRLTVSAFASARSRRSALLRSRAPPPATFAVPI